MSTNLPRFYVDHAEYDSRTIWTVIDRQDEYPRRDYSSVERAEDRLRELQRWTRAEARASSRK